MLTLLHDSNCCPEPDLVCAGGHAKKAFDNDQSKLSSQCWAPLKLTWLSKGIIPFRSYVANFQLVLLYDQQIQEQRIGTETMAQIKSLASSSAGHGHREAMHLWDESEKWIPTFGKYELKRKHIGELESTALNREAEWIYFLPLFLFQLFFILGFVTKPSQLCRILGQSPEWVL